MDGPEPTTHPQTPIESPVWSETADVRPPDHSTGPPSTPVVAPSDSDESPPPAESRARLRLRMRRGATLGSLAFFLFLLNDLAVGRYETPFDRIGLIIHGASTLVGIIVAAILWSPCRLEKRQLRALDCIIIAAPVAFHLVTARPPFVGSNLLQLISDQKEKPPPLPRSLRDGIPGDLEDVILRCLEKDPARRFQSALELREALSACDCAGRWTEQDASEAREARPAVSG